MARPNLRVFSTKAERTRAAGVFEALLTRAEAEHFAAVDVEIARLRTPADVRRWQRAVRRDLAEILGPFPERTPLKPRITGRIERSDVIVENVIFESRPGYYVTANLYLPTRHPLPAPGVLIPCGHAKLGKHYRLYRDAGIGLARKGYVALVYDPTGQGERSECYDPKTHRHWVHREVPQHHWTGKPCFLTGTTLVGYRAWDGIRALDYLCSREEVDETRIGVMGNSGGGAMTLVITAVDERVTACAAGHPGGSLENTHLRGRRPPDRRLYSLIAPRPCRIIVGDTSGEEAGHRRKLDIMRPFYEACGCLARLDFVLVDGKHDLRTPKREAAYEWFQRWLGGPETDAREPRFRTIAEKALRCTKEGQVQASLRGETMVSLNRARAEAITPKRTMPRSKAAFLKERNRLRRAVAKRLGFERVTAPLNARTVRVNRTKAVSVETLVFESEPGMPIPALLLVPAECDAAAPVVIHTSEASKPTSLEPAGLPLLLAREGCPVLSIDVRDTGETAIGPMTDNDTWPPRTRNWRNFNGARWRHDVLAIRALGIGRSRSAMRVLDVIRAVDFVEEREDLTGRDAVVVGEGRGGIWALKAAAFDRRIAAVAAVRMLPSYRLLTDNTDYSQFQYFWVPGALADYDLSDLPALVAPRPVWIIDPIDQMSRRLDKREALDFFTWARGAYDLLGAPEALAICRTGGSAASVARALMVSGATGGSSASAENHAGTGR